MSQTDIAAVRAAWEGFARGDIDAATAVMDENVRWYGAGDPDAETACSSRSDAGAFVGQAIADGVSADLLEVRELGDDRYLAVIHMHVPEDWEAPPEPHGELVAMRGGKVIEMVVYPTVEDALAAATRT